MTVGFSAVRRRVFEQCSELRGHLIEIDRLEELEENPDVAPAEVAKEGVGGIRHLLGMGRGFLRFMEIRNEALLEERMGLGEYMYLYVLAYREQLRLEKTSRFADLEDAHVGGRARDELTRILENQLEALEAGERGDEEAAWAAELREELASLKAGEKELPWADVLPAKIAASMAPYAASLDSLYCSGIAKIELSQKNKGLEFRN